MAAQPPKPPQSPPSPQSPRPPLKPDHLLGILKGLSRELRELDVGEVVPRVACPSALDFLRDYVSPNKPVVVTGAIDHWPALRLWSNEYLGAAAGHVTVAFTPDGRADAVTALPGGEGECFALPYQRHMPMGEFLELLCCRRRSCQTAAAAAAAAAAMSAEPRKDAVPASQPPSSAEAGDRGAAGLGPGPLVPYLQYQNSSLLEEAPTLVHDVEAELGWASSAFGGSPEAVNLWIGDERSVSSVHKDPFENVYAVVAGTKVFTLLPPSDVYRMRLRRYPVGGYRAADTSTADGAASAAGASGLSLELLAPAQTVLWSSWQPEQVAAAATAAAAGGDDGAAGLLAEPGLPRPLRVAVGPGEVLYLPAMWWHQVEQVPDPEGRAIAVNYWYDMAWDVKQAGLQAVERMAVAAGLNEAPPLD